MDLSHDRKQEQVSNMLENLRQFSVETDDIKEEPISEDEGRVSNEGAEDEATSEDDEKVNYDEKYTSEVYIGFSSHSESDNDSDFTFEVPVDYSKTLPAVPEEPRELRTREKSKKSSGRTTRSQTSKSRKSLKSKKTKKDPAAGSAKNDIVKDKNAKVKNFPCDLCSRKFHHMSYLKRHLLQHKTNFHSNCSICSRKIPDPEKLKRHMEMHYKSKSYICPTCGNTFYRLSNFTRHEQKCGNLHGIKIIRPPEPVLCTLCGKLCKSKYSLQQHMMVHNDVRPHPCDMCTKRFRFKSKLDEHRRTHLGIKPYPCPICKKKFTTASDLNKHKKRHGNPNFKHYKAGIEPERETCHICHKQVLHLKTHIYFTHEKGTDNTCQICGKLLKSKPSLYSHIKVHLEGLPYECVVCKRRFNRKDNMLQHWRRHAVPSYKPKGYKMQHAQEDTDC